MVKKEIFCKAISRMMEINDISTEIDNVISNLTKKLAIESFSYYGEMTVLNDALIDTLADGDSKIIDCIIQFCYDANYGRDKKHNIFYDLDDKEVALLNSGDLYDFIMNNHL